MISHEGLDMLEQAVEFAVVRTAAAEGVPEEDIWMLVEQIAKANQED